MEDQAGLSGAKWLVTVHFFSGCPPYSSAESSASFAFYERCAKVLRGERSDLSEGQMHAMRYLSTHKGLQPAEVKSPQQNHCTNQSWFYELPLM